MTTNTAKAIIEKAYVDAGKVQRSGVPTPAQYLDGLDRLNDIINLEQTQGLKLWLETEQSVTLTSGKQMYSVLSGGDVDVTKPLRIKQASYADSSGSLRPLTPISREEWTRLANRSTSGSINQYFVEKLYDRLNVYLWNVPDATAATGTVRLVLHNQATNPAIISEGTAFPPEWVIFLRWALAEDLSTGMPEAIIQRCTGKTEIFRQKLEGWDVEDAPTYFQPETQWLTGSRFA